MNYDVFISCKHEDYEIAALVYDFLKDKGFSVFIASESLRRSGNTAYLDEIDKALESCKHMIVFTTRSEYARSTFVKEEWMTFRNEKLSGRKKGNLLTIIGDGLTISDLPIGLRRYEVLPYKSFRKTILDYIKCPEINSSSAPKSPEAIVCSSVPNEGAPVFKEEKSLTLGIGETPIYKISNGINLILQKIEGRNLYIGELPICEIEEAFQKKVEEQKTSNEEVDLDSDNGDILSSVTKATALLIPEILALYLFVKIFQHLGSDDSDSLTEIQNILALSSVLELRKQYQIPLMIASSEEKKEFHMNGLCPVIMNFEESNSKYDTMLETELKKAIEEYTAKNENN